MKRSTKIISIVLIFFFIIAAVIIARTMIGNHFKKKFSKRPPPGIIVQVVEQKLFQNHIFLKIMGHTKTICCRKIVFYFQKFWMILSNSVENPLLGDSNWWGLSGFSKHQNPLVSELTLFENRGILTGKCSVFPPSNPCA